MNLFLTLNDCYLGGIDAVGGIGGFVLKAVDIPPSLLKLISWRTVFTCDW